MSSFIIDIEYLKILLYKYGIAGIFIVSLISNSIPYLTVPYLLLIAIYASFVRDILYKILIILFSALGASFGKVIVYLIGFSFRQIVSENTKKNLDFFSKHFIKSTFITVFLFASLPLPDDVVYLPIGVTKYDLKKFFIALFLGKLLICGLTVYYSSLVVFFIEGFSELPYYLSIPLLVLVTMYISYLIISIDWFKLLSTLREKGFYKFIYVLFHEVFIVTINLFKKILKSTHIFKKIYCFLVVLVLH